MSIPDFIMILQALNIEENLLNISNAKIAIWKIGQRGAKQRKKKRKLLLKKKQNKEATNYLHNNPQTPKSVSKIQKRQNAARKEKLRVFQQMR